MAESEMIERVAKAIRDTNANTVGLTFTDLSKAMARAAIDAMREQYVEQIMQNWGIDGEDERVPRRPIPEEQG